MARRKRDPQKETLVKAILNEYQPESVEDMQDALKDIFGPMFETMLQIVLYRFRYSTTNAVESIHSSFRKVTKPGAFPNENGMLKLLYL